MYKDISKENQKIYEITEPGEYIFYFENKTGDLIFDIQCSRADIKIYGLYECKDLDEIMLNITQKHSSPNSTSHVLIKSILKNKSTFNFTGTIHIPRNAVNSTAHLINNNLLLSDTAHIITTPQLEVIPHNTKCTHATTITPLDENQINYLIARGIKKVNAEKLLINGFINEVKDKKISHKN